MHKNVLLLPGVLLVLSGCVTYSAEKAAHYRVVHDNVPIGIRVSSEVSAAGGGSALVADAIRKIPASMESYLTKNGIEVLNTGAARHLDVTISGATVGNFLITALGSPEMFLIARAAYTAPDGTSQSFTINVNSATTNDAKTLADIIARTVIDEALLMWHPAAAAIDAVPPAGKAVGYALFPESTTGKKTPIPHDEPVILSWETFPSERMLRGSGISAAQISDVSYQVRIGRYRDLQGDGKAPPPNVGMPTQDFAGIKMQQLELSAPSLNLGYQVPWCGDITWSVRARFKLNGHPRVTAWSRQSHLSAPGFPVRVGAADGFDCYTSILGSPIGAEAAWASEEPMQLAPLTATAGVASLVLTGSRCATDNSPCSADAHRDNNKALRRGLEKAIDKLGAQIRVRDGGDIVDPAWFGDGKQAFTLTPADLYLWLSNNGNKAALRDIGISRVLAIHSSAREERGPLVDTSNTENEPVVTHYGGRVDSRLAMLADIIDVETGNRVAQLDLTAEGSRGAGIAFVFLIPIPYAYDIDAFQDGVARIATIGAYALMGARMGWPDEFRDEDK